MIAGFLLQAAALGMLLVQPAMNADRLIAAQPGLTLEHGSGGEQATPFVPEFMPNGAGPLVATSAGRLPDGRS